LLANVKRPDDSKEPQDKKYHRHDAAVDRCAGRTSQPQNSMKGPKNATWNPDNTFCVVLTAYLLLINLMPIFDLTPGLVSD
jgi:hypothetical protein